MIFHLKKTFFSRKVDRFTWVKRKINKNKEMLNDCNETTIHQSTIEDAASNYMKPYGLKLPTVFFKSVMKL